jgi:hypothetical protein
VYAVGGLESTGGCRRTVDRYRLDQATGAIRWVRFETPLPACRRSAAAVIRGAWLYVMGGGATDDVVRAPLAADGVLGAWEVAGQLPPGLRGEPLGAAIIQDHLVVVSDRRADRVAFNNDGTLAQQTLESLAAPPALGADSALPFVATSTHVYATGSGGVSVAAILPDGRLGAWSTVGYGTWSGIAIVSDMLYVWGFGTCRESICAGQAARARIASNGTLGMFEPTNYPGAGRAGATGLAVGRWVYVFGGAENRISCDCWEASGSARRTPVGGPIVTSASPRVSADTGGDLLVITGSNFDRAVRLFFDRREVQLSSVSANRLEATIPPGPANALISVYVRNPDATEWRFSFLYSATLPSSPTLRVEVVTTTILFSWTLPLNSPPATNYSLAIGRSPGASDAGTFDVGNVLSIQTTLPPGRYFARVRARNASGSSGPSNEVEFVSGGGTGAPNAPASLAAIVQFARVQLSWQSGAQVQPVAGYIVEAGTSPGLANLLAENVGAVTSLIVDGVPSGRYYVRVRAFNAASIGPPSNEIEVVVGAPFGPPGAPMSLRASQSGSSVTLNWSPPAAGGPVATYIIEAGSASGASNLAVQPVGSVTAVTIAGVPRGTYFVRIRAANSVGTSDPSNEVLVVVP